MAKPTPSVIPPAPVEGRPAQLAADRLRAAAQRVEFTQVGLEAIARRRARTAGRVTNVDEVQAALNVLDEGFDALDALLAAIAPVHQQIAEAQSLMKNLLAASLDTAPEVQAALAGHTSHVSATKVAPRSGAQRIVVRPTVFERNR